MARTRRIDDADLLVVARDTFIRDGFGASTRTIAQQAGVSEATLFQRFRTKPELFFAAMVPSAPDLHAILTSRDPSEQPSVRMEEIALGVFAYFREIMPVLLPLIVHPEFSYERFIERYPDSPLNTLIGGLQTWLSGLERRGIVAPGESGTTAITIISSMSSLALFEQLGVHGGEMGEQIVRQIAQLIWRGGTAADPG